VGCDEAHETRSVNSIIHRLIKGLWVGHHRFPSVTPTSNHTLDFRSHPDFIFQKERRSDGPYDAFDGVHRPEPEPVSTTDDRILINPDPFLAREPWAV
jgi:hypothetical protein